MRVLLITFLTMPGCGSDHGGARDAGVQDSGIPEPGAWKRPFLGAFLEAYGRAP